MKKFFTARHFDASEDLKQFSLDTVEKLQKFYDNIIDVDIVLEPSSSDEEPHSAEINVNVPQSHLKSAETATTYEQAVNEAVENLSRQLKKYKEKRKAKY